MKVKKYETLYHEDHGATLKHKCGKRIVTLSLVSFSLIFFFFFFSSFPFSFCGLLWPLLFIMGFFGLFIYFLTWDNALTMMIITLLFTHNSRLQQDMTLYECMAMMMGVIMNGAVELHGNISRNGYEDAIIGRYGGCFDKRNWSDLMHRRELRGTRVASKVEG
jgi:hypothetical protein